MFNSFCGSFAAAPVRALAIGLPIAIALSGCISPLTPTFREPERLYPIDQQLSVTRNYVEKALEETPNPTKAQRNSIISAYMFAIDIEYTRYEAALTHEVESEGFGASALIQVLSTTGAVVAAPTAHILSAVTSGVNGIDSAYNQKILLSNAIQNLETQMRSDRSDQAAYIYANMKCSTGSYPMAMALSDIELYYRAGTLPSALIGLSKTVNKADTDSKAAKQANAPAAPAAATTQLQASANVTKAKASTRTSCQVVTPGG
jgi:hypothetical protein